MIRMMQDWAHQDGMAVRPYMQRCILRKKAEAFNFYWVPFVYFCFYFQYSGRWVIEVPAVMYVGECFAYVLLYEFYSFWS